MGSFHFPEALFPRESDGLTVSGSITASNQGRALHPLCSWVEAGSFESTPSTGLSSDPVLTVEAELLQKSGSSCVGIIETVRIIILPP